jgi:hypothetical protein
MRRLPTCSVSTGSQPEAHERTARHQRADLHSDTLGRLATGNERLHPNSARLAGKGSQRRSDIAAVPVAAQITETVAPPIIEQAAVEPVPHHQWGGKYDALRAGTMIERQDRA